MMMMMMLMWQVYNDICERYDIEQFRPANSASRPRSATSQACFRRAQYVAYCCVVSTYEHGY